jgi:hypothetical protein
MVLPRQDAREVRECPICPPYVRTCAHWDGAKLFLTDRYHESIPTHERDWFERTTAPQFLGGRDQETPREISYFYEGDDPEAALAAFYEAESRLLGRGE